MTDFVAVFDGGSLGNPGHGYGSYRLRRAGGPWAEPVRLDYGDRVTSNEAEYRSLIAALEAVASACGDPAATTVEVRGDSRLVLNHLTGAWKVRAANLVPWHRAARQAVARFKSVRLSWQPRAESVRLLGH